MVLSLLIMSCLIEPLIAIAYKSKRKIINHKCKSIQGTEPDSEFRILACVHSVRNVMGTLSLLNLSHATKRSPVSVFAVHLLELSKRNNTAMLIVHDKCTLGGNRYSREKTETANIIRAFEDFEKANNAVTVQTMSVISPYTTMHMDICSLAEDKCVNLIIVPFHKQLKADGKMGNGNSNFANVNNNVLLHAPCSVGVLVDRETGSSLFDSQFSTSGDFTRHMAMLYVGGPDDREALAYAWRMAGSGNHNVSLTVARFLPGEEAAELNLQNNEIVDREKQVDDEYIEEFKIKSMNNNWIQFTEKFVNNGEETIAAIRAMGDAYDLYVIGRREGAVKSPVTQGLSDWGSCPELGVIGDTLASSNFALHASVLVVQRYISPDAIYETSNNLLVCLR